MVNERRRMNNKKLKITHTHKYIEPENQFSFVYDLENYTRNLQKIQLKFFSNDIF